MYNEIWATGGWGSIEYSHGDGQVEGGRWKTLHYILRSSTFTDNLCTCTAGAACFLTNDSPFVYQGSVKLQLLNTMSGAKSETTRNMSMAPGATGERLTWFCAEGNATKIAIADSDTLMTYTKHRGQIPS